MTAELQARGRSGVPPLIRLVRPHQWVKNLLVFFPVVAAHRLLPKDELMEYICQENNRDVKHLVGPAGRP